MYEECFEVEMGLKQKIKDFHRVYSTCKYLAICRDLSASQRHNLSEYQKTDEKLKQKIWGISAVWNIVEGLEIAIANALPATTAIASTIYGIKEDSLVGLSGLIISIAIHQGIKNIFNQFKTEGYIFLKEENEVINAKCELKRLQLEEKKKKEISLETNVNNSNFQDNKKPVKNEREFKDANELAEFELMAAECLEDEDVNELLGIQDAEDFTQNELDKNWKCPDYMPEDLT